MADSVLFAVDKDLTTFIADQPSLAHVSIRRQPRVDGAGAAIPGTDRLVLDDRPRRRSLSITWEGLDRFRLREQKPDMQVVVTAEPRARFWVGPEGAVSYAEMIASAQEWLVL